MFCSGDTVIDTFKQIALKEFIARNHQIHYKWKRIKSPSTSVSSMRYHYSIFKSVYHYEVYNMYPEDREKSLHK